MLVTSSIRWRKRLTDAPALAAVLAERGVELVLHGHAHRDSRLWLPTPAGRAPVIGVRSASMHGEDAARRAQYHLFRISDRGGAWNVRLSVREYVPDEHRFAPVDAWEVELPGPRERDKESERGTETET